MLIVGLFSDHWGKVHCQGCSVTWSRTVFLSLSVPFPVALWLHTYCIIGAAASAHRVHYCQWILSGKWELLPCCDFKGSQCTKAETQLHSQSRRAVGHPQTAMKEGDQYSYSVLFGKQQCVPLSPITGICLPYQHSWISIAKKVN